MNLSRVLRSLFAVAVLTAVSGAALATAPYDATGATVELVPAAGGAALATTRITFPPDAVTTTLTIPSATIAALAPGGSINLLARVTSDALTAGSTCTANVLSRAFTFTRAAAVTPTATVPTLSVFGLMLLAGLVGAVAWRSRRDARLLNVVLPAVLLIGFTLVSAPTLNAQATDPNTTYASSASAGMQAVRAVVDAGGVVTITVTRAASCEGIPTGPSLADVGPILDRGGNPISFNLNALGGLPSGSTVVAVVGFPTLDDFSVNTNLICNSVGACTAVYDVDAGLGFRKTFSVVVKVAVPGFTRTLDRLLNIIIENEA